MKEIIENLKSKDTLSQVVEILINANKEKDPVKKESYMKLIANIKAIVA